MKTIIVLSATVACLTAGRVTGYGYGRLITDGPVAVKRRLTGDAHQITTGTNPEDMGTMAKSVRSDSAPPA